MLILHRVLFCTGIDLHNIMQIDCLAYKYFVFIAFYWLITTFGIVLYVIKGLPPSPQSSTIYIYQKSEFLKLIIIRIICEF